MKKLIATLALLGTASACFAQAYVSFFNASLTRVSTNGSAFGGGVGPTAAGPAGTWYYALLVAPTSQTTIDASLDGWTFVAMATNSGYGPGFMVGGEPGDSGVQVPGYPGLSYANFAVVGWSGNIGSDWNSIYAGRPTWLGPDYSGGASWAALQEQPWNSIWYGVSSIAYDVQLASAPGPYNDVFGPSSYGLIDGMTLDPVLVPEPSVVALAGISGALLFLRRKTR
jgi:hypothetical protein